MRCLMYLGVSWRYTDDRDKGKSHPIPIINEIPIQDLDSSGVRIGNGLGSIREATLFSRDMACEWLCTYLKKSSLEWHIIEPRNAQNLNTLLSVLKS